MHRLTSQIQHHDVRKAHIVLCCAAWIVLLGVVPAAAQVFKVEGGTSTVIDAHGGSVEFTAPNYEGWVGFGYLNGFHTGAFFQTRFRGYTLGFGDDTIQFDLPTDVFSGRAYVQGRGVSVAKDFEQYRFYAFAGAATREFPTSFFRGSDVENGIGVLFFDAQLKPNLRFFSRNAFAGKFTSIQGLSWQARDWLKTSVAAGSGGNDPYFSASLEMDRQWIRAKASYTAAGTDFHRLTKVPFTSAEADGGNFEVNLHPTRTLSFTLGHSNLLLPLRKDTDLVRRSSYDRYGASWQVAGFGLSGSLYNSRSKRGKSRSHSLGIRRNITDRINASATLLSTRPISGARTNTVLLTVSERINSRLRLEQYLIRSQGRTTISYGGRFESNLITVGVGYSTLYIPFALGNQFRQALTLSVGFRPFGNYQFGIRTFHTPTGETKYAVTGSTYLSRNGYGNGHSHRPTFTIPRFIVMGRVMDDEYQPVAGAALLIDNQVVFTDSQGRFFLRTNKARLCPVEVLLNQFLLPGHYEVLSAPTEAVSHTDEGAATEVLIILRRVQPPPRPRTLNLQPETQDNAPLESAGDAKQPRSPETGKQQVPAVVPPAASQRKTPSSGASQQQVPPAPSKASTTPQPKAETKDKQASQQPTPRPAEPAKPSATATAKPADKAGTPTAETEKEKPAAAAGPDSPTAPKPTVATKDTQVGKSPEASPGQPAKTAAPTPAKPSDKKQTPTAQPEAKEKPVPSAPKAPSAPKPEAKSAGKVSEPSPAKTPSAATPKKPAETPAAPAAPSSKKPSSKTVLIPEEKPATETVQRAGQPEVKDRPVPATSPTRTRPATSPLVCTVSGADSVAGEIPLGDLLNETGGYVLFGYDRIEITESAARALDQAAACLRNYPQARVLIEGHADTIGSEPYNYRLGHRRAISVRDYLIQSGVNAEQLGIASAGKYKPFCTESLTESCRRLNRRVHFFLLQP